ncbi:MAG TPA: hypothetical protein VN229_04005, partial [Terriglobales bacterium]|nr:hypothetical protein [Terriglobales bacterium]
MTAAQLLRPRAAGWHVGPLSAGNLLPWLGLAAAMMAWWHWSDLPGEIFDQWQDILFLGGQHVGLVCSAGGLAIVTGIPAGAVLSR